MADLAVEVSDLSKAHVPSSRAAGDQVVDRMFPATAARLPTFGDASRARGTAASAPQDTPGPAGGDGDGAHDAVTASHATFGVVVANRDHPTNEPRLGDDGIRPTNGVPLEQPALATPTATAVHHDGDLGVAERPHLTLARPLGRLHQHAVSRYDRCAHGGSRHVEPQRVRRCRAAQH